jgi:hypothetical protein
MPCRHRVEPLLRRGNLPVPNGVGYPLPVVFRVDAL